MRALPRAELQRWAHKVLLAPRSARRLSLLVDACTGPASRPPSAAPSERARPKRGATAEAVSIDDPAAFAAACELHARTEGTPPPPAP